ncbi:MAG: hypothetical protein ACPIOQ_47070, partial [Promethearchaeia archaeon]
MRAHAVARAGEPSFKAAGAMKAEAVARHMVATSRERRAAMLEGLGRRRNGLAFFAEFQKEANTKKPVFCWDSVGGARFDTSTSREACVAMAWRSARLAAFVVAAAAAVCLAGSIVLACGGTAPAVLRQQPSSVSKWMNTLKGAESFLDDAESGRLPARALSDGDQLSSVESMIRKTKEAVHREATRLHSLEAPKQTLPIGAKKTALMTAPGEQNEGFQGLARNDKRPGQVMREVSDL